MKGAQILVVEDERIVAEDIRDILGRFGYEVAGVASSGSEAMQKTAHTHPDLVLMDIMLRGSFDGVHAAEQMRTIFNIPVVYLTAHADKNTLERAVRTGPFGYLVKPFDEKELHSTIQVALHKHAMEQRRNEKEGQWAKTLRSIGEPVIATDTAGRVTFMNPVAETLTGWREYEALGEDMRRIFKITASPTPGLAEDLVRKVIREGIVIRGAHQSVNPMSKDETERRIVNSIAPIRDAKGRITGAVIVLADGTEAWWEDEDWQTSFSD